MTLPADPPVQPVNPDQQDKGKSGAAPEGYIELARYNGLIRKVEELTLANRDLNAQLVTKASEIEQLKSQLGIKDVEKQVAVSERDKSLNITLADLSKANEELVTLRSLRAKVNVANKLNRPELVKLAERIPNVTDEQILEGIMQDFARFADDAVKAREQQLLSGISLPIGPGSIGGAGAGNPASKEEWMKRINKAPLGSDERNKAVHDYGDWLEKQNKT
jgi:hypothetical protein